MSIGKLWTVALVAAGGIACVHADVIYPGFASTAGLTLNGSTSVATTSDGRVLRLTSATGGQSGSAFSSSQVNAADFSTFFQFRMTDPGGISPQGADGIVFVIQPVSSSLGGAGGGEGYAGITPSVGVEFDNYQNGFDPNNNHVGVLKNGDVTTYVAGPTTLPIQMTNGDLWSVWIDYDGTTLEIRANTTGARPIAPTLSSTLNIPSIIGQNNGFVGFTAGTGAAWSNQDIVDWRYNTTFSPIPGQVPEPATTILIAIGLGFIPVLRRLNAQASRQSRVRNECE